MLMEKKYRTKDNVGGYALQVGIQGDPELVLKVNEAITKETKTWKEIDEI